jgi:lipopolysaccharide exporter
MLPPPYQHHSEDRPLHRGMKNRNRAYWMRSALFSLLDRVGVQAFGMGTVMILLRIYADQPETYGVWALFLVVAAFLEVSRNGLIMSALIRYLGKAADQPAEYRKVATASMTLNLALTALFCVFLLAGSGWLGRLLKAPGLDGLLRLYALLTVLLLPMVQSTFMQQANLQFWGTTVVNLLRQGLFFVYVALAALLGWPLDLLALAWVQVALAGLASVVAWVYGRPFHRFDALPDWAWVMRLLRFGIYSFGTNLSTMLYKTIDRFMLGMLMPTQALAMQAVALFDPALRITNIMEIPVQAMANITFPQSARRMAEEGKGAVRHLYERSVGTVLTLLLPLCVAVLLFPELFIRILAGSSDTFLGAAGILQITILYTLFVPFARQFGVAMDTLGKPNWGFYFSLGGALANIASNYVFISQYGMIGAAYGTLLTFALRFVAQQYLLRRFLGVSLWRIGEHAVQFALTSFQTGAMLLRNPSSLSRFRKL